MKDNHVFQRGRTPCSPLRNVCGEAVMPLDWESGDHNSSPRSVPIHCMTLGKSLPGLSFPIWTLEGGGIR